MRPAGTSTQIATGGSGTSAHRHHRALRDEGAGDLTQGLLGSIGFEQLAPDGENRWQTKRLISFPVRMAESTGTPTATAPPGIPHSTRHGRGSSMMGRHSRMVPNRGQQQNIKTTESAIAGGEVALYEVVNRSADVITVKKLSRFVTEPLSAGRPPYVSGQGEGSFDIDVKAGCIHNYSFSIKLVVENNASAAATASLTYQRIGGNSKLASLPALPSPKAKSGTSKSPSPPPLPKASASRPPGGSVAKPSPQPKPASTKPVEVPSLASRSQAEKLLDDLFKKDFDGLDSATKRIEMARIFLKHAGDQKPGTADHYVLLDKARDLAMVGGDIGFTLELIDTISKSYEVDNLALKAWASPRWPKRQPPRTTNDSWRPRPSACSIRQSPATIWTTAVNWEPWRSKPPAKPTTKGSFPKRPARQGLQGLAKGLR